MFLAPLFTFVKEDKDGEEKPKETEVIEFLSKLEPTRYNINLHTQGQRVFEATVENGIHSWNFRTLKSIIAMLDKVARSTA